MKSSKTRWEITIYITVGDVRRTVTEVCPTGCEEVRHKAIVPRTILVDTSQHRIRDSTYSGNARPMNATILESISRSTNKFMTYPII